jgi:hypothetical protein
VGAVLELNWIEAVFQETHLCNEHNIDENAWCFHVNAKLTLVLLDRSLLLSTDLSRRLPLFKRSRLVSSSTPVPIAGWFLAAGRILAGTGLRSSSFQLLYRSGRRLHFAALHVAGQKPPLAFL